MVDSCIEVEVSISVPSPLIFVFRVIDGHVAFSVDTCVLTVLVALVLFVSGVLRDRIDGVSWPCF